MPGKSVLIPPSPGESEEKCSSGKNIASAAQQHLPWRRWIPRETGDLQAAKHHAGCRAAENGEQREVLRSEEHTSELQSPDHLVCRLLLEKKKRHNEVAVQAHALD